MAVDVLRRILIRANDDSAGPNTLFLFDEALRNERRATVERLRERFANEQHLDQCPRCIETHRILDEEAAR